MTRRANRTPRDPQGAGVRLEFMPHEFRMLRHNAPGPSGALGGYQRLENHLIEHTTEAMACFLEDRLVSRLIRYCKTYGHGGPNQRLRDACIPALRRAGIELLTGWHKP